MLGIPALQLAERDVSELATDALQRQTKAIRNIWDGEGIGSTGNCADSRTSRRASRRTVRRYKKLCTEPKYNYVRSRNNSERWPSCRPTHASKRRSKLPSRVANKRKPGSARTCGSCLQAAGGRQPPLSCSKRSKGSSAKQRRTGPTASRSGGARPRRRPAGAGCGVATA